MRPRPVSICQPGNLRSDSSHSDDATAYQCRVNLHISSPFRRFGERDRARVVEIKLFELEFMNIYGGRGPVLSYRSRELRVKG